MMMMNIWAQQQGAQTRPTAQRPRFNPPVQLKQLSPAVDVSTALITEAPAAQAQEKENKLKKQKENEVEEGETAENVQMSGGFKI